MKGIRLFAVIIGCITIVSLFIPSEPTEMMSNDVFSKVGGEEYVGSVEDADKYEGNIHAYYIDGRYYVDTYNLYSSTTDSWFTINGDKHIPLEAVREGMYEIPALIFTQTDGNGNKIVIGMTVYDQYGRKIE